MNNQLNNLYNFRDTIITRRIDQLKNQYTFLDWSQFYLGVDIIMYLASSQKKDTQNMVFTIYSKKSIPIINSNKIYLLDN